MKFLVDAQLPYGIALFLRDKGFDALHTNDLPDKEYTTDSQIRSIAVSENRIVITKDYDFVDSFILKNESCTFGHYWNSTLSTFQIFSPFEQNEKLSQLSHV
ncbi:MAG: DUF5615 family PIN-like protein [Lentimicrobiaceae bacterium]|nr:DUF5615 family PIN-like protein [Lentimicrobiaceae bacterium]